MDIIQKSELNYAKKTHKYRKAIFYKGTFEISWGFVCFSTRMDDKVKGQGQQTQPHSIYLKGCINVCVKKTLVLILRHMLKC